MPGDSVIIDGVEYTKEEITSETIDLDGKKFTKEELKTFLTERIVLKRQLDYVKELAGGVSSE